MLSDILLHRAVDLLTEARYAVAFTGAGISVESGIPPFRGEGGLWARVDPALFEIETFLSDPLSTWTVLRDLLYETFRRTAPNPAHRVLAGWEESGLLKSVITQNIDGLHTRAGSRNIVEYHGSSTTVCCTRCAETREVTPSLLQDLPPLCHSCGAVFKPDFVFFGEMIPVEAQRRADEEARRTDLMIVVGTTGEVFPAALLPHEAKRKGAVIVEVNTEPSALTSYITDIFLKGAASDVLTSLQNRLRR